MEQQMKALILLVAISLVGSGTVCAKTWQRFPSNYSLHSKRVKFQRGRTTSVIRGVARTPGIYEYVLRAKAGQYMTVHLTSANNGVEFTIFGPDDHDPDNALGVDDWEGRLEYPGDYKITLINNHSRISRNPKYTLEITIR
jgi:hypothetical protein